jgi:UDP-N-acetylglucosamine--N-acetylmuramyl-(pentapeptide) pyrophosphoryl-undecaprenol N-acetylglucosamine transferase
VPKEGIKYKAFKASGFDRAKPGKLPGAVLTVVRSMFKARKWLREISPAAVAGFGGYVSIPVGAAAHIGNDIPLLIHEQNSAPGLANRYLARSAAAIALTYDAAREKLIKYKDTSNDAPTDASNGASGDARDDSTGLSGVGPCVRVTGNPVRASIIDSASGQARLDAGLAFRANYDIPETAPVLLVFGGSQGARHINDAICDFAPRLLAASTMHIVHITGPKEYGRVQERARELARDDAACDNVDANAAAGAGCDVNAESQPILSADKALRWHLIDYCDDMPGAYAAASLAVCRSGASTLAEIAVMGLPAVLVPYPHATDDHQTANAQSLVSVNAAHMFADQDIDDISFADDISALMADTDALAKMANAALALNARGATNAVVELLLDIANKSGK